MHRQDFDLDHWMCFHEEGWNKPNQMTDKVAQALRFAEEKHKGQSRDDGQPYFKHITDVVDILLENGDGWEENLIIAALHDTLEDTDTTYEELNEKFGKEAAEGVRLLTKVKGEPFDEYANRIFNDDGEVYVGTIKLADRLANLRDLPFCGNPEKIKRYLADTRRCILTQRCDPTLKNKIMTEVIKMESPGNA